MKYAPLGLVITVAACGGGAGVDDAPATGVSYAATITWSVDDVPDLESVKVNGATIQRNDTVEHTFDTFDELLAAKDDVEVQTTGGRQVFELVPTACGGACDRGDGTGAGTHPCAEVRDERETWLFYRGVLAAAPDVPLDFAADEGNCMLRGSQGGIGWAF